MWTIVDTYEQQNLMGSNQAQAHQILARHEQNAHIFMEPYYRNPYEPDPYA